MSIIYNNKKFSISSCLLCQCSKIKKGNLITLKKRKPFKLSILIVLCCVKKSLRKISEKHRKKIIILKLCVKHTKYVTSSTSCIARE